MAQYLVQFVIDTDDGVTEESKKGNSLYVRDWFDRLTDIVSHSDDDVMASIDPYHMKLMSVANLAFLPKPADKKWYHFWK